MELKQPGMVWPVRNMRLLLVLEIWGYFMVQRVIGPEHAYFKKTGRAIYVSVTDDEALEAFQLLSRTEGIIPALESAHAVAYLLKLIPKTKKEEIVVVCLSGRGDKDTEVVIDKLGVE